MKLIKEEYPNSNDIKVSSDGKTIHIDVSMWNRNGKKFDFSKTPRRWYLEDYKEGKKAWKSGDIEYMNKYLEMHNLLMEEVV